MKNTESKNLIQEDECVVDDDINLVASAKLPYSTKQFKNWVYSDKGKVHAQHLPLFWLGNEEEHAGGIYSSFEEKDFMYLTHKEVEKLHINSVEMKDTYSVKYQRRTNKFRTTLKSHSEMRKKSSREILKEMLL